MVARLFFWRARRALGVVGAIVLGHLSLLGSGYAAGATNFTGGYEGIGPADGMAMVLSQDGEEVHGRLAVAGNNIYQLSGTRIGDTVQGRLSGPSGSAKFELAVKSSRILFTLTPVTADGAPNVQASKLYAFEKGKVSSKALSDFRVTPPRPGESVDMLRFLENYRGWSPHDVAIAYASLSDPDRALINRFDHLQTDIMNRLCRGAAPRASMMTVSDKEDLTCDELIALIDRSKVIGKIGAFNEIAQSQRASLYSVIACKRDLYPAGRCGRTGTIQKNAAKRWQSAGKILNDIATLGVRSGALVDEVLDRPLSDAKREIAEDASTSEAGTSQVGESETNEPSVSAKDKAGERKHSRDSDEAKGKREVAARAKSVPTPRRRPAGHGDAMLFAHEPAVVDTILAKADQSAEVKRAKPEPASNEVLALGLRPSLGKAALAGTARTNRSAKPNSATRSPAEHPATGDDVLPSDPTLVPLPRRRPPASG